MSSNRELPTRESHLFKTVLRFYELRKYKKGLKATDQILKKVPEHGGRPIVACPKCVETLAMKGLFLYHVDRKDEGYETTKRGLLKDMKSHICTHKNYEEAIKCYRNALKFDKNNLQILRDLSLLQVQMREFEGYNATRDILLQLQSNQTHMWLGYAVSFHLLKEYDLAIDVIDAYENALKTKPPKTNYEHSELLLYRNFILEDSGDLLSALANLDRIEPRTCDPKHIREKRAELLLRVGRLEEAKEAYMALLEDNPDNVLYLESYLKSWKVYVSREETPDEAQLGNLLAMCETLAAKFPRSIMLKRYPLIFAKGDAFTTLLHAYLQFGLRKGIPSLFASLKTLYADKAKVAIIHHVVTTYVENLAAHGQFSTVGEQELPTTLLWSLYFLAQHYDKVNDMKQAIETIDRAVEHTPTLVELHMTRARILKHAGDVNGAMEAMNEARELDLQDRFINNKCAKYMLRNGKLAEAEKTVALFTRPNHDPTKDLLDMQCIWYVYEVGMAHMRAQRYGMALKWFHRVEKIFDDYYEDQFDFHSYALRKGTTRFYMQMLKFEDQLRSHPYYFKAALAGAECYLQIHDRPRGTIDNVDTSTMSAADLKKHKKKQRKAELKAQSEPEKKPAATEKKDNVATALVDEDPNGDNYLNVEHPLEAALKLLTPLLELAAKRKEPHLAAFKVYLRQHKLLLALKTLLKLRTLDPHDAGYQASVYALHAKVLSSDVSAVQRKVLLEHLQEMLPTADYTVDYAAKTYPDSFEHVVTAMEALHLTQPDAKQQAYATYESALTSKPFTVKELEHATRSLVYTFHDPTQAQQLSTALLACLPRSPRKPLVLHATDSP